MPPSRLTAIVIALLIATAMVGVARPAAAHTSLLSSAPADGSVLDNVPAQISLIFASSVPVETVTLEMIDAAGARVELTDIAHGPGGEFEIVAPLPSNAAGEVTLRWRLVGPDGHALTGRVGFTVTATPSAPPETAAVADPQTPPADGAIEQQPAPVPDQAPSSAQPSDTNSPPSVQQPSLVTAAPSSGAVPMFDAPYTTSATSRWALRTLAYIGILTVVGAFVITALVWPGAANQRSVLIAIAAALVMLAVTSIAQLFVIASDITGDPPRSAASGIRAALRTNAGLALAARLLIVPALCAAVIFTRLRSSIRLVLTMPLVIVALATWAYAGHGRSMRWPLLGMPLDIAHHLAAATWLTGLAIVGRVAARRASPEDLSRAVVRFSRVAAICVTTLVVTGAAQTFRLHGSLGALLDVDHGRGLMVKAAFLAAMLWFADSNRRHVSARFRDIPVIDQRTIRTLRRSMAAELAIGVGIIAVTAAIVVSPPTTAESAGSSVDPTLTAPTIDIV